MSKLTQLYRELNQRFWNGRLPDYRVRFCKLPVGKKGECLSERGLIRLTVGLEEDELRRTLLHEMCHIGCHYHGQKFLARLIRLAEQGEQWATEEAEMYRNGPSWNESIRMIRDDLFTIALDGTPRFRDVVAFFARDFGEHPARFIKRIPWLKAAWQKAQHDAEQIKGTRQWQS